MERKVKKSPNSQHRERVQESTGRESKRKVKKLKKEERDVEVEGQRVDLSITWGLEREKKILCHVVWIIERERKIYCD